MVAAIMRPLLDIALRRDATGRYDLAVEGRDLAWDRTPATPLIVALGSDRRAEPDDELPDGTRARDAAEVGSRRGWPGDALFAARLGSRDWLLVRAKQTETTRLRAIAYAEAACWWLRERGYEVAVAAEWVLRGRLRRTVRAGSARFVQDVAAG